MSIDADGLRALAAGVALDADLDLVVGPPRSGWFIEVETGRIHVDGGDVGVLPDDELKGLVCHEAAHAAVTRYPFLVPQKLLRQNGMPSLFNALEDCRIEDWLVRRLPGTAPWVDQYNRRLFPEDAEDLGRQPWFQQFCLGAIHEWWHGEPPDTLASEVAEALLQTRAARRRFVACQPPLRAELGPVGAYEAHPVARLFRRRDPFDLPDGFEREVRLQAYDAYRILWVEIRPTYAALVARDRQNLGKLTAQEEAFLRRLSRLIDPPLLPRPRRPSGPPSASVEEGLPVLPAVLRDAVRRVVAPPPVEGWDAARRDVLPLADHLVDALVRVLRPDSYPRFLPGFPSGERLDLRVAMALVARPDGYTRLWRRKTLPARLDPAFLLLLDLSGSMAGERIAAAFRGVVLLAKVLSRLCIPYAVCGFQDVLLPFKDFQTPLDPQTRDRLGAMPQEVDGVRTGGHNRPEHNWDGPVLRAAAEVLEDFGARSPVLVVVSDGVPSGPSPAEAALHEAVAGVGRRVHLIGVGLGPGTDHVRRFYPDALAGVPLADFPAALGRCIDSVLRRRDR